MVVDDEVEVVNSVVDYFQSQGIKANGFTDPNSALKQIKNLKPDVVFLDIKMPELDGYQFCEKLMATPGLSGTPVIFVSGRERSDDALTFLKNGGRLYVKKPFEMRELKELAELAVGDSL